MKFSIPPKILYPGMIVSVLGLSIVANIVVIVSASGDQGAQVIDNYYEVAANYDKVISQREETARLGWTTRVMMRPAQDGSTRIIDFFVKDANDQPLKGATGNVVLYNPAKSKSLGEAPLRAVNDGIYSVTIEGKNLDRKGLYDVVLSIEHDGSHYQQTMRQDVE